MRVVGSWGMEPWEKQGQEWGHECWQVLEESECAGQNIRGRQGPGDGLVLWEEGPGDPEASSARSTQRPSASGTPSPPGGSTTEVLRSLVRASPACVTTSQHPESATLAAPWSSLSYPHSNSPLAHFKNLSKFGIVLSNNTHKISFHVRSIFCSRKIIKKIFKRHLPTSHPKSSEHIWGNNNLHYTKSSLCTHRALVPEPPWIPQFESLL